MNELLQDGFILVVLGMGAVFLFLGLLVSVTSLMSKLVMRWTVESPAIPVKPVNTASPRATPPNETNPRLLAVIAAALHQHRSRHK